MFCSKCGKEIPEGVAFCPMCGAVVAQPVQPFAPAAQNRGPVKRGPFYFPRNPPAICSYYFGWGTLIALIFTVLAMAMTGSPFLSWVLILLFPVGTAALVTGICGLAYAHRHPEGRGVGHAVFGVVMGSLTLVTTVLTFFVHIAYYNRYH